jgi:hypothetical protein
MRSWFATSKGRHAVDFGALGLTVGSMAGRAARGIGALEPLFHDGINISEAVSIGDLSMRILLPFRQAVGSPEVFRPSLSSADWDETNRSFNPARRLPIAAANFPRARFHNRGPILNVLPTDYVPVDDAARADLFSFGVDYSTAPNTAAWLGAAAGSYDPQEWLALIYPTREQWSHLGEVRIVQQGEFGSSGDRTDRAGQITYEWVRRCELIATSSVLKTLGRNRRIRVGFARPRALFCFDSDLTYIAALGIEAPSALLRNGDEPALAAGAATI